MTVSDRDYRVWMSWDDGKVRRRGPVLGYVTRGKKVGAVIALKRKPVWVPFSELTIVSRRKG